MERSLLVWLREDGADAERLDDLAALLQQELLAAELDDVSRLSRGTAPPGARGVDVNEVGVLLVTLSQSVASLKVVIGAIRSWLSRGRDVQRTIKLELGGNTLELSNMSEAEQVRLIEVFVARSSAGGDDQWMVDAKP